MSSGVFAASAQSIASMMDLDDINEFLQDEVLEDVDCAAKESIDVCAMCSMRSNQTDPVNPKKLVCFPKPTRDLYCHLVHVLLFGEQVWTAALQNYICV